MHPDMERGAPRPGDGDAWVASTTSTPSRRIVAVLSVFAMASTGLTGLWVTGAEATGSTTPVVFKAHSPAAASTILPLATPTTAPPPPPTTTTTVPQPPPPPPPPPATVPPPPPASAPAAPAPGWGCDSALTYLATHSAPGFTASCPGPNDGHQATTTAYYSNGDVTGTIGIEVPCPAAYMNEAHNSWVLRAQYLGTSIPDGLGAVIDPYGYCH
jgi:hypothetical protein